MQKKILITGSRNPTTLHLIRILKNNYSIYTADDESLELAGYSKYTTAHYHITTPLLNDKRFKEDLITIITQQKIDYLLPTCEEVFHVANIKPELEQYVKVLCSDLDKLLLLHSKYNFITFLQHSGLAFPSTEIIDNISDLKNKSAQKSSFVLKPEYSRFSSKTIINDKKAVLQLTAQDITINKKWVLQEYITGEHYCSTSYALNGKVTIHSCYPVTYRIGNGAALYFTRIDILEIKEFVEQVVQKLNITGFISFDFIKDIHRNTYIPIECNPRLTSGISLFIEQEHLSVTTNINCQQPIYKRNAMIAIGMLYYFGNLLHQHNFFKLIKDFYKAKDIVFSRKDWKPFFKQFNVFKTLKKIAKQYNISLVEASTYDIEWNNTDLK